MTWQAWQARTTYWHFCYTFHTAGVPQESKGAWRIGGRVPPLEPGATTTCASVYVGVSIFVVDVLPPCRSLHVSHTLKPPLYHHLLTIRITPPQQQQVWLGRRRRSIIKFYFRHSIWEMSSVYDGFLTCLVIEYSVGSIPFGFVLLLAAFWFWYPCGWYHSFVRAFKYLLELWNY